jgi:hypothetical protein
MGFESCRVARAQGVGSSEWEMVVACSLIIKHTSVTFS